MKNYAGHRLSPWLGHLMVSRSETARPLLTPGEIMQLPSDDAIVMVAGTRPIRAKKARYYQDTHLMARIMKADDPAKEPFPDRKKDEWLNFRACPSEALKTIKVSDGQPNTLPDDGGHDRRQEFDEGKEFSSEQTTNEKYNEFLAYNDPSPTIKNRSINIQMGVIARQTDLDRDNPSNQ